MIHLMSSPTPPGLPPQFPPQQPVASKSKGPLFWILITLGILVVLVIGAATVGSFFIYRAAKNAGLDPSLMKNNPGLATAKLLVAANPDLQAVSTDDGSGTITVRQKSTGDILKLRFDMEKKTMIATDKDGKEVTFRVSGDQNAGSFEINSDKGDVKFGAATGNSMPAWVPVYPGSSPQGTMSSQTPEGNQSVFTFKTKDSASQVVDYYQKELISAGLQMTSRGGGDYGGVLTAEDASKSRTVVINVQSEPGGSQGAITVVEKKQP